MRLLMSYTTVDFRSLPPAVPSPGCLSFCSLDTTSVRDTLLESSMFVTRIRLVHVEFSSSFSVHHS